MEAIENFVVWFLNTPWGIGIIAGAVTYAVAYGFRLALAKIVANPKTAPLAPIVEEAENLVKNAVSKAADDLKAGKSPATVVQDVLEGAKAEAIADLPQTESALAQEANVLINGTPKQAVTPGGGVVNLPSPIPVNGKQGFARVELMLATVVALAVGAGCAIFQPVPNQTVNCLKAEASVKTGTQAALCLAKGGGTSAVEQCYLGLGEGAALDLLECEALAIWGDLEAAKTASDNANATAQVAISPSDMQAAAQTYLSAKGAIVVIPPATGTTSTTGGTTGAPSAGGNSTGTSGH